MHMIIQQKAAEFLENWRKQLEHVQKFNFSTQQALYFHRIHLLLLSLYKFIQ